MSTVVKDLGAVSAYAYAVEKGYTGTEAEFAELMADYAEVGQRAEDAADSALESKTAAQTAATTATNKASEATTAATTATTKAGEASTSASTATSAKDTAVSAASTATTKATEATTAAATATSAKTDAVAANTAAQSAKTAAQTAQTGAETAAASVQSSAAQIATNAADISQLKSDLKSAFDDLDEYDVKDIPKIKEKLMLIKSANVFNKDNAVSGRLDGTGAVGVDSKHKTSDYIPVNAGDVVKTYYVANDVVNVANMATICGYNEGKAFVSGTRNTYINTLTVPDGVSYIRFSVSSGMAETFMLIVNGEQPIAYIPYANYYIASKDFIDSAVATYGFATSPIKKEDTDFWSKATSENLFDKNSIISGEYFNVNGSIGTTANVFRSYVELDGAGTYSFNVMGNFFGLANAVKIPTFDKNKSFIKTITGSTEDTTTSNKDLMTLVISQQDIDDGVVYIGYSEHPDNLNDLMIVKSSSYPSYYIPYYKRWTLPDLSITPEFMANPLYGKVAVFDGDSICEGANSAMGNYGNGWAGRIGVDNSMIYHNTGVGGGTITAGLYFNNNTARPRHWLCTYIDTIHANYPDLDYLILDGGTNDADNLFGQTAKIGTIDETDYNRDNEPNHFDAETYCGALDTLFYKVQQYYPKKKVGFIIAQKMGRALNADGNPDPYIANRRHFFDLAIQACKKWGIPYIDLWHDGYLNPNSTAMYDPQYNTAQTATEHGLCYIDGQHLTAYGYDVISSKISEWMKTL